jgi:CBS domain-containing protein
MSNQVTNFLAQAAASPAELTVRELLTIWGARYRDYDTVGRIQSDLAAVGLTCEPPLAAGEMTAKVRIGLRAAQSEDSPSAADQEAADETAGDEVVLPQFSLQVGDIPSATGGITSVLADATLEEAQGIMLRRGFSQLAVMTAEHSLRGAVSWEYIAQAYVRSNTITLADAIDPFPRVVYASQELFEQLTTIYHAGYVFVRGDDGQVCGIVTTADLTDQFQLRTEPFFQLGEIERRLRRGIDQAFSIDELQCVASRRSPIVSVDEMTFYQYVRLLDDDVRWQKLNWRVARPDFVAELDEVRRIRNPIMHFRTDLLTPEQQEQLKSLLRSMRRLVPQ